MRLFRSDRLEALTVMTPRAFVLIWSVYLVLIAFLAWGKADAVSGLGLVALGLLIWSLFEYSLHRFLFHWNPKSKVFRALVFVTHGNHHVDPSDPHRNLMPVVVSLPLSFVVWGLCVLALEAAGTILFLGIVSGYVIYDSVHYVCHQVTTRGRLLRHLQHHHNRHHYAKREGNYAITMTVWDRVFGTLIPAKRS
jgi:sterol desaturase/sphingolipid hydroxylase (fatty acid hydroxylase superfamily)